MHARCILTSILLASAVLLTGCGDDTTTPTSTDTPEIVDRPTTVAIARTTTAASVWSMNDLAALAAHWVDGDLRSTPPRLAVTDFSDEATFDATTTTWTVPLRTDFRVGPEIYAVHGIASVTFLAADTVVMHANDADAMRAEVVLDVLPRLGRATQRDLEMTSTVLLTVTDVSTRPLAIAGQGSTVGRYSLVDDETDHRSAVDMQWSFDLSNTYRDCCPTGVVDLRLDGWHTEVAMDGSPTVATRMVVDQDWVEDVALELPCVLVQDARGTSLESKAPLLRRARGGDVALDLVSTIDGRSSAMGERIAGSLSVRGVLEGEVLPEVSIPIDRTWNTEDALRGLHARLYEVTNWPVVFDVNDDGRLELDNTSLGSLPVATQRITLWGNLDSDSDGRGSRLLQTGALLADAEGADDLRSLRSGADGDELLLTTGDAIELAGTVAGVTIPDEQFVIGQIGDGYDGTTVEDLRAWFQRGLQRNGAPAATVVLYPNGAFRVSNAASDPLLEDITLHAAGRVAFNQVMHFGDRIRAGSSQTSAEALLSPSTETDIISDLSNGDGDRLNFQFVDDGHGKIITSMMIGGTLGGLPITPVVFLVEEGVTPVSELFARITQAFRISNFDGVALDHEGRIEVRGDVGQANSLDNITMTEPGNLFSNLSTSMDFTILEEARDANIYRVTSPIYDSLGNTHDLSIAFTKRTGYNIWDWVATLDEDEEFTAGQSGTVTFDEQGRLASWQYDDHNGQIEFLPQPADEQGAELVTIAVDPGDPGRSNGLTQYSWSDAIESATDGRGYSWNVRASEVVVRMTTTDGVFNESVVLARFDEVDGGTVAVANALAHPADGGTPFDQLTTAAGLPLIVPNVDASRTLEIETTIDGTTDAHLFTVGDRSTVLAEVLAAIAGALDVPAPSVALADDGHVVVSTPLETGVVSRLRVRERDAVNPVLAATLDFEVTAQSTAGCR